MGAPALVSNDTACPLVAAAAASRCLLHATYSATSVTITTTVAALEIPPTRATCAKLIDETPMASYVAWSLGSCPGAQARDESMVRMYWQGLFGVAGVKVTLVRFDGKDNAHLKVALMAMPAHCPDMSDTKSM